MEKKGIEANRNFAIGMTDTKKKNVPLEKRLKKQQKSLDDYLTQCQDGGLRDEIIASTIDRHLLPRFPEIAQGLAEAAAAGNIKAVEQSIKLIQRISALLNRFQSSKQELHFHLSKMSPEQLLEEGEYQVKTYLQALASLPDGPKKIEKLMAEVLTMSQMKKEEPHPALASLLAAEKASQVVDVPFTLPASEHGASSN